MSNYHTSVLLEEAVAFLSVKPDGLYIDCTLGGGGHTQRILDSGGRVLAIDADAQAIDHAKPLLSQYQNLTLVRANFAHLGNIARSNHFEQVDGILYDLGVSSHQLDTGDRGFSFDQDAPLDMRMDQTLSVTAADLVAALGSKELKQLLTRYGDEPAAGKIAEAIVRDRKTTPIRTTGQLAHLIEHTVKHHGHLHPATKVFQALRIAVNDELHALEDSLVQALDLLKPAGRLVVISFHSGEDRLVKQFFRELEAQHKVNLLTKKPEKPSPRELATNPRSRSARLRAVQKL